MRFFKNPSKFLAGAAVLGGYLLLAPPAEVVADDEPFSLSSALMGDEAPFQIGGWTQLGYHNRNTGDGFNTHPHRLNLQQEWLWIEREADGSEGLDFGFRFDVMYGTDANAAQSFGNPPGSWDFMNGFDHGIYGWGLPQLYVDVAYKDWNVRAGRFFTPLGYEVVGAPGNFFYSHAFTHNYNEPFGHTGALVTYALGEGTTLYSGWTAGWDTGFDRFHDGDDSRGSNYLGGASVGLTDDVTATYLTTVGDLGFIGEGYTHSIVISADLAEDLEYVLSTDLVEVNGGPGTGTNHRFGWANYLFYTINDMLKAGVRAEWFNSGSHDLYEITGGVNITPTSNLIIRPEVRWQGGGDGDEVFFNDTFGIPSDGAIFGIDAILTY